MKSPREIQQEEIETIKERKISLKLSDADVERISKKAATVNLSVSELIESFIGDLVDGTYSNGSDERMYANEWFNRCGFSMFPSKTFLRYLIEYGELEYVIGLWSDIEACKEELAEDSSNDDAEYIEGVKEDLNHFQISIDEIFQVYKKRSKDEEVGTLEEEMRKVLEWDESMKQLKNEKFRK